MQAIVATPLTVAAVIVAMSMLTSPVPAHRRFRLSGEPILAKPGVRVQFTFRTRLLCLEWCKAGRIDVPMRFTGQLRQLRYSNLS